MKLMIIGFLSFFLGLSNAQAACDDDDGDDPYTWSSTANSGGDPSIDEFCHSDGTTYVINEIYCDGEETNSKTYYCNLCATGAKGEDVYCEEEGEVTVTNTWHDSDNGGASELMVPGTIYRDTEVFSDRLISSGTYTTSFTDKCQAGSPGQIMEYRVVSNTASGKLMYCPKGTKCTSGACK